MQRGGATTQEVISLSSYLSCSPAAGFILKGEGQGLSSLLAVVGAKLARWAWSLTTGTRAGLGGQTQADTWFISVSFFWGILGCIVSWLTWAEGLQEERGGGRLRLAAAGEWAWRQLEGAQLGPCFLTSQPGQQINESFLYFLCIFTL